MPKGVYVRTADYRERHKETMNRPETKRNISDGAKRRWAKEKVKDEESKAKEIPQPTKEILPIRPDTLGFHMNDTKEFLIGFSIEGITPEIIFDFERNSIKIEIPDVFSISSGNQDREAMKQLAGILNRDYSPEKRQRLDVARRLKFVMKGNRKAAIEKFFSNKIEGHDGQ